MRGGDYVRSDDDGRMLNWPSIAHFPPWAAIGSGKTNTREEEGEEVGGWLAAEITLNLSTKFTTSPPPAAHSLFCHLYIGRQWRAQPLYRPITVQVCMETAIFF